MKNHIRIGAFLACALLTGCGGGSSTPPPSGLPPGKHFSDNAVLRVGDKITVQLSGTPDPFFNEKQIPSSGDITLPYLNSPVKAVGMTAADLSASITAAYKDQKIFKNPVVTVFAETQYITIGGDVRSSSNVQYRPDLTLMGVINSVGGFTDFANRRSVRVIRGSQVFYVDCNKASKEPGADPPVYPGDQIYVSRTPF